MSQPIPKLMMFGHIGPFLLPIGLAVYLLAAGFYTHPVFRGSQALVLMGETQQEFSIQKNIEKDYGSALGDLTADFFHYLNSGPVVCKQFATVNGFQREQCTEYWLRMILVGGLLFLPILAMGLLYTILNTIAQSRLVRAWRLVATQKNPVLAVVKSAPKKKWDRFCWFHGVRAIRVGLPDGREIDAYMAFDEDLPLPHEKLCVVEWGKFMGETRYFGTLHAPYMSVTGRS